MPSYDEMNVPEDEFRHFIRGYWKRTDQTISAHLKKLVPQAPRSLLSGLTQQNAQLGQGRWGMVFKTKAPGWVVKFTADATEGPVTALIMQYPKLRKHPGICYFGGIWRLPVETYYGDPIFVILREDITPIGDKPPGLTTACFDEVAVALLDASNSAEKLNRNIDRNHAKAAMRNGSKWAEAVEELMEYSQTEDIADFMFAFFEKLDGVLADVHLGNVGRRLRKNKLSGNPRHPQNWVILDPGVSSITRQANVPYLPNPSTPIPLI